MEEYSDAVEAPISRGSHWWLYAQDHIQTTRRTNDPGVWATFETNGITTPDGNEVAHVFLYLYMSLHRGRCMEVESHCSRIVTMRGEPGVWPERSNVSCNTAFSWYWQPALGYSLLLTALVPSRALQAGCRQGKDKEWESSSEVAQQLCWGWIGNELEAGWISMPILMGSIKVRDISSKSGCLTFIRKSPEGLQTWANCTCHKIDGFSWQLLPDAICYLNSSSTKDLEAVHTISQARPLNRYWRLFSVLRSWRRPWRQARRQAWAGWLWWQVGDYVESETTCKACALRSTSSTWCLSFH